MIVFVGVDGGIGDICLPSLKTLALGLLIPRQTKLWKSVFEERKKRRDARNEETWIRVYIRRCDQVLEPHYQRRLCLEWVGVCAGGLV